MEIFNDAVIETQWTIWGGKGNADHTIGERKTTYSRIPAAKPTTARRPPARAPTATAPLDFDEDEEDVGALLVVDPDPDPEPEPEAVVLEVEEGVPSADDALAAAWNASKDLFAVGLMANTMPCSQ
jgi:hypothetical protein